MSPLDRNLLSYENGLFFCPSCGGQMCIIALPENPKAIDEIISHLKLRSQAEWPSPFQVIQQELLVAAERWWTISDGLCGCSSDSRTEFISN
jgi:hypothetical protein